MRALVTDLYAVLGVQPEAGPEEIRAAFYRTVREHPPERDPPGFQRARDAYQVLGDPARRQSYDATRDADPETQALAEEGRRRLDGGDAAAALPLLRQAVQRRPRSPGLRDLLTQALLALGMGDEAARQAREVLAAAPGNPAYHLRLGDSLRVQGKLEEALPHERRAFGLAPARSDTAVRLANLLQTLGRSGEAAAVLEENLRCEGGAGFDDLASLQGLCRAHAASDDLPSLLTTHDRLRKAVPQDVETLSHVAWFHYTHALDLEKLGQFEAALCAIAEAAGLDGSLPNVRPINERLHRRQAAAAEDIERLFLTLVCPHPGCGRQARLQRPTAQSLVVGGLGTAQALELLRTEGERGALRHITLVCDRCQGSYNGLSEPVAP